MKLTCRLKFARCEIKLSVREKNFYERDLYQSSFIIRTLVLRIVLLDFNNVSSLISKSHFIFWRNVTEMCFFPERNDECMLSAIPRDISYFFIYRKTCTFNIWYAKWNGKKSAGKECPVADFKKFTNSLKHYEIFYKAIQINVHHITLTKLPYISEEVYKILVCRGEKSLFFNLKIIVH